MKIDRLIGILSILLQKEMTTAPELADHFEVSRRTINRDITAEKLKTVIRHPIRVLDVRGLLEIRGISVQQRPKWNVDHPLSADRNGV